ncbi:radical SAM domain protein [Anaerococcus tetradius ATCC 35098]|uniref:Radical SAM domain protein n=1 Tax=Anaerococcus tetradius ATCC 35098 TaxID=525255 RepID=C2CIW4_9FIRM|nr:radical SAM domain protein [Anaerococcus tetradius ATCC 35098]
MLLISYNELLTFNRFKVFEYNNKNYIFDIDSPKMFTVDNTLLSIIKKGSITKKEFLEKSVSIYGEEYSKKIIDYLKNIGFINYKENEPNQYEINSVTFFMTNKCNLKCKYCYINQDDVSTNKEMDEITSKKCIDYLLKISKKEFLVINFFGGEPLLNFDVIKSTIDYCHRLDRKFVFSVTTNGTLLDAKTMDFFLKNDVVINISIDGNNIINDSNRIYTNGQGSHSKILESVLKLRNETNLRAMSTITDQNLDLVSLFKYLDNLNFYEVNMSPAYNVLVGDKFDLYINNYIELIRYARKLLKEKEYLKLKKINLVMDILNQIHWCIKSYYGCSAGITELTFDGNGDIYPCHAFVDNKRFKFGNINSIPEKMLENRLNYIQNLKIDFFNGKYKCSNCWIKHFCSGGCIFLNLNENNSIYKTVPRHCKMKRSIYENLILFYLNLNQEQINELFIKTMEC